MTGVRTYPRPTTGTIVGAPNTQTPSRAEHGSRGRFAFGKDVLPKVITGAQGNLTLDAIVH